MENNWKDLEIGNIPSDFFVNDMYEIRFINNFGFIEESGNTQDIKRRTDIVSSLRSGYRYQFRNKPTDSYKVNREFYEKLLSMQVLEVYSFKGKIRDIDGRPLEIIDENT